MDTVTTGNLSALAGSTQSWSLNAVGDQSSVTTDGTTVNNTSNSQNEETGVGSNTLTYDNAGDQTTDQNGNTLKYDAWGHLIQEKNSGGTTIASFTYDANGRRVSQTENSTTTVFYISPSTGNVIEERVSGTVTDQEIWGAAYTNELIARDDNSTSGNLGISGSGLGRRLYTQFDAIYSITAVLNISGTVQERFIEGPYGARLVLTAAGTSTTTDSFGMLYGFQGGRIDPVTGLYLFNAKGDGRDYDPVTGTWREQDKGGYINGPNRYQNEMSNPVNDVDPTGQSIAEEYGLDGQRLVKQWVDPATGQTHQRYQLGQTGDDGSFDPHVNLNDNQDRVMTDGNPHQPGEGGKFYREDILPDPHRGLPGEVGGAYFRSDGEDDPNDPGAIPPSDEGSDEGGGQSPFDPNNTYDQMLMQWAATLKRFQDELQNQARENASFTCKQFLYAAGLSMLGVLMRGVTGIGGEEGSAGYEADQKRMDFLQSEIDETEEKIANIQNGNGVRGDGPYDTTGSEQYLAELLQELAALTAKWGQ